MSRTSTNRFSGLRSSCAAAVESAYRSASGSPAAQWLRQMLASDDMRDATVVDAPHAPAAASAGAEHMQSLEGRQLLASIGLSGGLLTITGDSSTVHLGAKLDSTGTKIAANAGSTWKYFDRASVTSVKIVGGSASEYMSVSNALNLKSTFVGNGGNDTVYAGGGNDTISGGDGNDDLHGRNGADAVGGGNGNDSLNGGAGNDALDGGAGTDKVTGGTGTNTFINAETITDAPAPTPAPSPSPTPAPTPSPVLSAGSAPTAVITAMQTKIAAGHGLHVQGTNSTLGAGTPVTAHYEWDFGDPNGKYNKLVGFNAAHAYDTPGTYTVTLKLTNQAGKVSTAKVTVTVTAANRKIVYVSSSGSDANAGTSSSAPIKTFAKAASMTNTQSNLEIRFKRGEQFAAGGALVIHGTNVLIGAYGSGAKPQINWTGAAGGTVFSTWGNDATIQDLTFNDANGAATAVNAHAKNVLVRNLTFLKMGQGINNNMLPVGVLFQDNEERLVDGMHDSIAWIQGTDQVYLGNYMANSTGAQCMRNGGGDRILWAYNELDNLDRRPNGVSWDFDKQSMAVHVGTYDYLYRNIFHHGRVELGPLGGVDGVNQPNYLQQRLKYAVMDGNVIQSGLDVNHGAEHIVLRNNVFRVDNWYGIKIGEYSNQYQRGVVDLSIINNTELTYGDSGNFIKLTGKAQGITVQNNLYVGNSVSPGANTAAPIYVQQSDLSSFTLINNNVYSVGKILSYAQGGVNYIWPMWSDARGYQTPTEWNALPQVGTDKFSSVTISGTTYAPSTTSSVAAAGAAVAGVFTDFYGNARSIASSGISVGAVQV